MKVTVFSVILILLQVALVLLFGLTTDYYRTAATVVVNVTGNTTVTTTVTATASPIFPVFTRDMYPPFVDIHVLVFFGLGILMSCVYRSSFTAAGFSLLLASMSVLWSLLNHAFWQQAAGLASGATWVNLPISPARMAEAEYAAATVLVTFGALLGRVSAAQAVVVALFEVIIYNILFAVGRQNFAITDVGGSTDTFFFGAVFGLITSAVLAKLSKRTIDRNLVFGTQTSSTTAMVGMLFSWCFWPSFNSIAAASSGEVFSNVNTYLALCASTITAFATGRLISGKDQPQNVLLATIAGGVAMGTGSVMLVRNFGAILIGGFAGIVSTLSLAFLTPALERAGFPDTIGVFSAFGLPGIIGTLVGIITSAAYRANEYSGYPLVSTTNWPRLSQYTSSGTQGSYQLAYIGLALGLALVGGTIAGLLAWFAPALETTYNDAEEWVLEADIVPAPVEVEMDQKLEVF